MSERSLRARVGDETFLARLVDGVTVAIEGADALRSVHPVAADSYRVVTREASDSPVSFLVWARRDHDTVWVFVDGDAFEVELEPVGRAHRAGGAAGSLSAPMPATVIQVLVHPGERVTRGQTIALLEAMKMELPLKAPRDGTVRAVRCAPGELVQPGPGLVELE